MEADKVKEEAPGLEGTGGGQAILPIFLIVLVDVFGMTLVIPLQAIYAETFRATAFEATLLVSVFAACQLVSGPLMGRISDRIGRKPLLLVSQVGTCLGFILMAQARSLWMIYVARVIDGSTAGNLSIAQAYISDNTQAKNRTKAFALIGIAFGVGFSVGPGLSGFLCKHFTITAPIYLAAGMSAMSILSTAILLPKARRRSHATVTGDSGGTNATANTPPNAPPSPGPGGKRLSILDWGAYVQYFREPVMCSLLLQFFFFMFSFQLFISGFALFAERNFTWRGKPFSPTEIGYLFMYSGFLGIILQGGLIGRLARRFGERRLVAAGFTALVAAYCLLGFIHTVVLLVVVATVFSFGNGVLRPALTTLVTHNAGRHVQGEVLGLMQSLSSIAGIIAPGVGGLLIEGATGRWGGAWAWTAAVMGIAGWIMARKGVGRSAAGAEAV